MNGDREHGVGKSTWRVRIHIRSEAWGVAVVSLVGLGEAAQHTSKEALGGRVILARRRQAPGAQGSGGPGSPAAVTEGGGGDIN